MPTKFKNKTTELVNGAMITKLSPLAPLVKTTIYDEGKEFANLYASWQRGPNENFNGLLRQYISKKRLLSTVTDEEFQIIQEQLNNRPRKRLGFKTPSEVFMKSSNSVALHV